MPPILELGFTALLGLVAGSFGTMLLHRVPRGESLLGRSRCPHCQITLRPGELIPVLSFLFQRGRCKNCKTQISSRYLIFELLTAGLFVLHVSTHDTAPYTILLLQSMALFSLLLIAFSDAETKMIPDLFLWMLFLTAFFNQFLREGMGEEGAVLDAFVGGVIPLAFFGCLWLFSAGRWIGSGDLLLGTGIGVFLGMKLTLLALFFAYLIGGLVALFLLLTRRVVMGDTIPFGPFLSIGAVIAFFMGETLLVHYEKFLPYMP